MTGVQTCALPICGFAQDTFPNRPIRILCGFGVGGGTDVVARVIGQKMSENWGQGVVVDNRTGAGGIIAAETLARANPDGHSLIIVAVGHAFAASYYKKLPYDTLKDFAGVTSVSDAAKRFRDRKTEQPEVTNFGHELIGIVPCALQIGRAHV